MFNRIDNIRRAFFIYILLLFRNYGKLYVNYLLLKATDDLNPEDHELHKSLHDNIVVCNL